MYSKVKNIVHGGIRMNKLEQNFEKSVNLKYSVYNSLFLTLPFDTISSTGTLLPILAEQCYQGLRDGVTPVEIIKRFFDDNRQFSTIEEQHAFLFRVIQFVERQIVLVDALEDAAYSTINDLDGEHSLHALGPELGTLENGKNLAGMLKEYAVRLVLTAHPTQFYPGTVLGILTDLVTAIQQNDLDQIRLLLLQLGKTPFFRKENPTPFDEAVNLSWYLENIFYPAAGKLMDKVQTMAGEDENATVNPNLLQFGFWPGGDRDGNPYVNSDITLKVAARLRHILLRSYYRDIRKLRRRLSFRGVYEKINELETVIGNMLHNEQAVECNLNLIQNSLDEITMELQDKHDGLFVNEVQSFKNRVSLFGLHFASIDIRQDSRVIAAAFNDITEKQPGILPQEWESMENESRAAWLFTMNTEYKGESELPPVSKDTLQTFSVIKKIQSMCGEAGAHRFIISNCRGAADIARVFALARLSGWRDGLTLDIVPLFETIEDLKNAEQAMKLIYSNREYRKHLSNRGDKQTVMLGFSDGTKDGGYFSANWNIYRAKETISAISREFGIKVSFFDGRGGPPARGGGNTHKFYTSLGCNIENSQIQVTVQGQTISSFYGTIASAMHNMETLLTAGLENRLACNLGRNLTESDRKILDSLAAISQEKYQGLKESPRFTAYLQHMSPLRYYGQANIASRPSSRKQNSELKLEDLRAIPFVGAWSQLKQNVPGYYGVGTSLSIFEKEGRLDDLIDLYKRCSFFRALCENSMQSLSKTWFPLTAYMEKDHEFGEFWLDLKNEYDLTCEMLLKVSGQNRLLETSPVSRESIRLREQIVLPLLTIQQYALMSLREIGTGEEEKRKPLEKLVIRCMFGNINASRNSV
jgi:phosphoenolpyruvate carboxylase